MIYNDLDYCEIGLRIREIRDRRNMNQKSFAEALRITQGHLSRVEHGAAISDALIDLIAEKFGIPRDRLLYGEDDALQGKNATYCTNASDLYLPRFVNPESLKQTPNTEWVCTPGDVSYRNLRGQEAIAKVSGRTGIPVSFLRELTEEAREGIDLIEKHNGMYAIFIPEIRDMDTVLHYDRKMYPAMACVFTISLNMMPMCYQWTASEEECVIIPKEYMPSDEHPSEDDIINLINTIRENGIKRRKKSGGNTCTREPFHCEMNTSFDDLPSSDGRPSPKEIWDYRTAQELALRFGLKGPKNEKDKRIRELLQLDTRETESSKNAVISTYGTCFAKDGRIDWPREFERFRKKIRETAAGKSLSAEDTDNRFGQTGPVSCNGQNFSLNRFGHASIAVRGHEYGNPEIEFIIDDKRISGKQFLELLESYEGWTMEFVFRDKS